MQEAQEEPDDVPVWSKALDFVPFLKPNVDNILITFSEWQYGHDIDCS
jgi:hypothetical protein